MREPYRFSFPGVDLGVLRSTERCKGSCFVLSSCSSNLANPPNFSVYPCSSCGIMGTFQEAEASREPTILKLPHPYLTPYEITNVSSSGTSSTYQLKLLEAQDGNTGLHPPTALHTDTISFSEVMFPRDNEVPPTGDNSSWARARRAPYSLISWSAKQPIAAQIWLISYALVTQHPFTEHFRVELNGKGSQQLSRELQSSGLFHRHPSPSDATLPMDGFLLLRGCFWQGAGSPFGTRPIWAPNLDSSNKPITTEYPLFPFQVSPTTQFPALPRHIMHPIRAAKPAAGSVIYSRWIPHLKEHFSMIALNYKDPEHLMLFHTWQNDPRVAAGWNETGTLEQHREYLRKLDEDPHVLTIFAKFDEILFAYFEVYWAMVRLSISLVFCTYKAYLARRRIISGPTTSLILMIAAVTLLLATFASAARTVSPHGGLA